MNENIQNLLLVLNHKSINNTMVNPIVTLLGDHAACIAYVRLTQYLDKYEQFPVL